MKNRNKINLDLETSKLSAILMLLHNNVNRGFSIDSISNASGAISAACRKLCKE